jgi:hypothetical protein
VRDRFEVGDVLDAMDEVEKWYISTVAAVVSDKVLIRFSSWYSLA